MGQKVKESELHDEWGHFAPKLGRLAYCTLTCVLKLKRVSCTLTCELKLKRVKANEVRSESFKGKERLKKRKEKKDPLRRRMKKASAYNVAYIGIWYMTRTKTTR